MAYRYRRLSTYIFTGSNVRISLFCCASDVAGLVLDATQLKRNAEQLLCSRGEGVESMPLLVDGAKLSLLPAAKKAAFGFNLLKSVEGGISSPGIKGK